MPGNTTIRYQCVDTANEDGRGYAILGSVGDRRRYEIPIEWLPDNLARGVTLDVMVDGKAGTVTMKVVGGEGPKLTTAIIGG